MTHIQRDERGEIIGLLQRPLTAHEAGSGEWQAAEPGDPDVLAFARQLGDAGPSNPLALTDAELAQADDYEVEAYVRVKAVLKSGTECWIYAAAELT